MSEEMENGGKWQPCVSDHPAGRAGHGGRLGEGGARIITLTIFLDSYEERFDLKCVGRRVFRGFCILLAGILIYGLFFC